MSVENTIKDVITNKLEDGLVEKLIGEQLEKGINNALNSLFSSYGDVTKVIESKVKSVMIPYLESYDYTDYILKLDSVLVKVLKNTALDHKKILTNFKTLIDNDEHGKSITVTELYEKWTDYVAKEVKTDDLEINYDDGVSYESVEVSYEVEYDNDRDWSSFEGALLNFECEHDEEMNFSIRLSRRKKSSDKGWDIEYKTSHDIKSLRYLNEFELLLMKLTQNGAKLVIDKDGDSDEVQPEKEPEPTFS
ncbi:hypothetical protein A616_16625 [Brevibacillus brevis X23]|nr:hypothetical protein A616_16625 [Brevibacillus brevis X23]